MARRLPKESYAAPPPPPDLSLLEEHRRVDLPGPFRPSGGPPYWDAGQVFTWHWGRSAEVLRVVRDDERGLVSWLSAGSEVMVASPLDGKGLRDRPLAERVTVAYEMRLRTWRGPGILRVAPTGKPWSLWYFWDEGGTFQGHYVNLELVHERPVDGSPRVHTRDLTLDLWLEDGDVWLKDADELEAAVEGGRSTPEQGDVIRAIGAFAAHELGHLGGWPLDEDWESWRPPSGWDEALALPDLAPVLAARAVGETPPSRLVGGCPNLERCPTSRSWSGSGSAPPCRPRSGCGTHRRCPPHQSRPCVPPLSNPPR